ncbi:hypothetical protein AB0F16_25970 [Streptomyces tanashiensis]|uniref:hypothetical protein n=1 Tax=Streptomyces tanashiensis TaxID=67367 RepID=UPI00340462DB
MTPAGRLAATRALLDQPTAPTGPGQTAIPLAALAVIEAAEQDASALHEDDHARAERVSRELGRSGWTITPA